MHLHHKSTHFGFSGGIHINLGQSAFFFANHELMIVQLVAIMLKICKVWGSNPDHHQKTNNKGLLVREDQTVFMCYTGKFENCVKV